MKGRAYLLLLYLSTLKALDRQHDLDDITKLYKPELYPLDTYTGTTTNPNLASIAKK